jgi:RHS repeat-associated protein
VTDARGQTTGYSYNTMDRVVSRTDPLDRQETYGYDAHGNLTSVTDRKSQTTTLTYDALDRPTGRTYQDAATIAYTWDAGNRLTQVVDALAGTLTLGYDGLDRVLSEATPTGTVGATYDALGRRLTLSVPGQGAISYGWDDGDRLVSLTQGSQVVGFEYDAANRRTKLTHPSGTATAYAYDAASRLTGLTYTHGTTTLGTLSYSYDAASQRTQVGGSWARTGLPGALASATYDAANRQATFGGATLTYDLNGNLTGDGTHTYTWDARDRLAAVSGPVGGSFVYDAFGRRQRKTVDGVITDFVYDGLTPVRQAVGAGAVDLLTGPGIDEYLVRTDGVGALDVLADGLGSTLALADGAGAVQPEYGYEPFGGTTASGTSSGNELRFTGREEDGTGLYYYRARYYHPGLQRFISEDPIGFAGGDVNLYAYVANQPTLFRDPTGHDLVAGTYGASGFLGVTTYMGRLSSVGLAGVASGAYGVSTTNGNPTGRGIAVTTGGVALNGPAQSNSFVMGLGFSKLGYGFMYSNADSFAQLTGAADTTLVALGPIGFQYDVSTDAATGRTIRNIGVSPALGLGIARFSTLSAGRDVRSYPCPHCPVEAALPGGGGLELRPLSGRK